jgi:nucleoside-triphosphatase
MPAFVRGIFLIDEIGKMECACPAFTAAMRRVLEGPVLVLTTVALEGGGFIAEVKVRPDVQLIEVAQGNRKDLPEVSSLGWGAGRIGWPP